MQTQTTNGTKQANAPDEQATAPTFRPNVDIVRTESEVLIFADLPGVERDGIEVDFDRGVLELRAKLSARATGRKPLREEYAVGDFQRSFRLSDEFDGSQAAAEYDDGVLCLRIPLSAAARAQKIPVSAGKA